VDAPTEGQKSSLSPFLTLAGYFPALVTTTVQPLWKPAQPQPEQRQLISPDSFFLLLARLFAKTIARIALGAMVDSSGYESRLDVVPRDLQPPG